MSYQSICPVFQRPCASGCVCSGHTKLYPNQDCVCSAASSTNVEEAAALVNETYSQFGRGTFSCDCGLDGIYIDGDTHPRELEALARLIEHARYEHTGRRSVLFMSPAIVVLDTARAEVSK